jgi:hypothetical protein
MIRKAWIEFGAGIATARQNVPGDRPATSNGRRRNSSTGNAA